MLGRTLLISALVLASGFAGCIGKGDDKVDPQQIDDNKTSALNSTEVPGGGGQISAFNETNKTETMGIGATMHQHDYWHNKDRLDDVAWINVNLIPFPLAPCKKAGGDCSAGATTPSTGDSGDTYPVGTAIADFALAPPPRMGMIYEGTKTVEVKLKSLGNGFGPTDQTDAPNPLGQVFFDYLTAADEAGAFHKGGELKLGQPVKIDIKPLEADMPHQTKSLWIFRVYSNSQMVSFDGNITISLVKGYDVVNWPPHPDLYGEHPSRVVFDGPVKLSSKGTADANLFGSDAGWLLPTKVLSWGTDRVEVEVTDAKFDGGGVPVPPKSYVLEYHNASKPPLLGNGAQFGGRLMDDKSDGKSYKFTIDLAGDRGDAYDTPYAQHSRWGFRFMPRWDDADTTCPSKIDTPMGNFGPFVQQFLVGCQWYPWTETFHLKITAYGHSTAGGVPQSAN